MNDDATIEPEEKDGDTIEKEVLAYVMAHKAADQECPSFWYCGPGSLTLDDSYTAADLRLLADAIDAICPAEE